MTTYAEVATFQLIDLAEAVATLHARIFEGDAAESGAIATGMTGSADTVPPEAMPILADALGGRYGETYSRIWDGDYGNPDDEHGPKGDASSADWALANELAYQAIRHRIVQEELGELIEQIMRASGAYRQKYDRPWTVTIDGETIRTTYLGVTIGKAIKRQQRRAAGRTTWYVDWFDDTDGSALTDETCPAIVAGLRRELGHARATIAVQKTVIRAERARRGALEQFVTTIDDVLARKDMSGTDKVMTLVATRELHTRVAKGIYTIARARLADLAGVGVSTVTTSLKRICTPEPKGRASEDYGPDGRPFKRFVTRKTVTDPETGMDMIVSTLEVTPWNATARETLQEPAMFAIPQDRPKHGGSKAAADARRPGCPKHQDANVIVSGICAECGDVLADGRVTAEQFDALKDQLDLSAPQSSATVDGVLKGYQLDLSAPAQVADDRAAATVALNLGGVQLRPGEREPVNLGRIRFERDGVQDGPPPKPGGETSGPLCGATKASGRECISTMYRDLGAGWLHCLGCGNRTGPLAAVAGGEE